MRFTSEEIGRIDVYRIKTDRWHRTWQAEWVKDDLTYCERAPRAWTRRGIVRKARRWVRQGR